MVTNWALRPVARAFVRRVSVALLAGLLTMLVASVIWAYLPARTIYHVREAYSFRATGKATALRLAVMVPKSGPYQQVRHLLLAWPGTRTTDLLPDANVLKLIGRVAPTNTIVATIEYDVILYQGRARWEAPVEPFQLHPQPGIESDAPALSQAASRLIEGQTRNDAYRIHKFTASCLSWHGQSGTDPSLRLQSALKAFETRQGVCGHFANLMTALCRAAKIPAQSVSGLSMPVYPPFWSATRNWGHPAVTHGWVEFHTPSGWEFADPSAAHLMPFKEFCFGRTTGNYLSYGERISQNHILETMQHWAAAVGAPVGGMTGPLRFAAAADNHVTFIPQATLTVTWSDRWLYLLLMISGLGTLVLRSLFKRRPVRLFLFPKNK